MSEFSLKVLSRVPDAHCLQGMPKAGFTLERFWIKTVQIDSVLTYRLHTNDENAREKRSHPNPLLKVD